MMTVIPVVANWDYSKRYFKTSKIRFDNLCIVQRDWFNDPVVEQMVLDIDKTKHVKDFVFESPILGTIPPQMLSGGVKGLILLLKDTDSDCRTYASTIFGDNCVEWIRRLSFEVDFNLLMCHPLGWNGAYWDGSKPRGQESSGPHPICAQTRDGRPLKYTSDISRYYNEEFDKIWRANKSRYVLEDDDDYEPLTDEDLIESLRYFGICGER